MPGQGSDPRRAHALGRPEDAPAAYELALSFADPAARRREELRRAHGELAEPIATFLAGVGAVAAEDGLSKELIESGINLLRRLKALEARVGDEEGARELAGRVRADQEAPRALGQGRRPDPQKVFVFHEVIPPDLEFLQVKPASAMIGAVDCAQVIKNFGQFHVGAIGYNPSFDEYGDQSEGFLTIASSFPLPGLDLSEPTWFFAYLNRNLVAQASDTLEQQMMGGTGLPDLF